MKLRTAIQQYRLPLLSLAVEIGPFIVFFVTEYFAGFFVGIAAMLLATLMSIFLAWLITQRLPWFAIWGTLVLTFFGTLSLYFMNEDIFIFQDTIIDLFFSITLLVTASWRTPLLKFFFQNAFAITDRAWKLLSIRWGILFLCLAIGNEIVRLAFTPDAWVYYKAASISIIIMFGMYQFTLSARERLPDVSDAWGLRVR